MAKTPNAYDEHKKTFNAPRGTLKWPKLTEPDHGSEKFPSKCEAGEYKTKLVLDRTKPGVQAFLDKLDAELAKAKELADEKFANLPVKTRKGLEAKGGITADLPYAVVYDDETEEETNLVELNVKMDAGGKRKKDGKPWSAKPALFDAKGSPLKKKIEIWGGTTAIVQFDTNPYFVEGTGKYGISRRLKAVQIINLVAAGGERSASSYGFGEEEDGWSQDVYEEAEDEDTDDDAGDDAGDDEVDF